MTQILNRFTEAVITEGDMGLRELVSHYVKKKGIDADLRDADLRGADLYGANLYGADLRCANLRGASLYGANLYGADLYGANLRGASLYGANLYGADLRDADLRDADLRGADLRGANLRDADLRGASLYGANLRDANLRDADLRGASYKDVNISKCAIFTGLYPYIAMPIIVQDGKEWIRLGCHFRTAEEWANDFWNNPSEFPNNGDMPSKLRWMAYQTCLQWLEINREGL